MTASRSALYSERMNTEHARELLEQELKRLEGRIEQLVATCHRLRSENGSLRERLETLTTERAGLLAKNEQVKNRVEAMISRLKALEENA